MKERLLVRVGNFFAGVCVGAADIVPGISGGTVAFIIGIYEELLASIASFNLKAFSLLLRFRVNDFLAAVKWKFLLAFILGAFTSFIVLAKGFQILLNDQNLRPLLYASFMGLVVGSCFFCARLLPKLRVSLCGYIAIGALIAFMLSGADLQPKSNERTYNVPLATFLPVTQKVVNYDASQNTLLDVPESQLAVMVAKKIITPESLVIQSSTLKKMPVKSCLDCKANAFFDFWVILCGMMAISAMLLPGISGSYILNILGMYGAILGALVDWVEGLKFGYFDFVSFQIVASMVLGIFFGALVFARVVRYMLSHYREETLALLVGFMIGALRAVWPFWSYNYYLSPMHLYDGVRLQPIDPVLPALSFDFALACLFFVLGLLLVFCVEYIANKKAS